MNKPELLRAAITAAVPGLERDPDKFQVFVDHGNVAATNTKSCSFEYRYTLNLILLDFAGDADLVFLALLIWAREHQPELLNNADLQRKGISFEVDHLNNAACDVSIKLPLTEVVKVTIQTDGSHAIEHPPEAKPEWLASSLAGF